MNRLTIFPAALAVILTVNTTLRAEGWPARSVTMVVPFAAGAGTDVLARILAPRLSELLGKQVIVENVGGAGGMNGSARVAKAAPDGYQFVLGTVGTHSQNQSLYKVPLYDAATDFEPVALVADIPPVLVARADLPVADMREFITYAKANQARMQYGSSGTGSAAQLACALLAAQIGVNITHLPYRGALAAMQDLIAGRIDYQCALLASTLPQIEAKQVKALATLTKERSPVAPDMPTADEQGVTGFEASAWHAVFLPKGTPKAIIDKLNAALSDTMDTPAVKDGMARFGATLVPKERRSPVYLAGFVNDEIRKWSAAIKTAGISAE